VGTKTIRMYVSDLDQSEIPAGQAYQLSIRHPYGSTQQLDISEKNYRLIQERRNDRRGPSTARPTAKLSAWCPWSRSHV